MGRLCDKVFGGIYVFFFAFPFFFANAPFRSLPFPALSRVLHTIFRVFLGLVVSSLNYASVVHPQTSLTCGCVRMKMFLGLGPPTAPSTHS